IPPSGHSHFLLHRSPARPSPLFPGLGERIPRKRGLLTVLRSPLAYLGAPALSPRTPSRSPAPLPADVLPRRETPVREFRVPSVDEGACCVLEEARRLLDNPDVVLISGSARLPDTVAGRHQYGRLGVVLAVERSTGRVVAADTTLITELAREFFRALVEGL